MTWDVVISGAGPAGTIAATSLARAGVRVLLLDRARFPRDKMCGDSLNPGAVALLARIHPGNWIDTHGRSTEGWRVTGPGRVAVEGRYPRRLCGQAVSRRDLDYWLLREAIKAGATFEDGVVVCRPIAAESRSGAGGVCVGGVMVRSSGGRETPLRARITIAADGRRSPVAFGLRLASHPVRPRRWAIGACFENVAGTSTLGEMHIRAGGYLGMAQLASGLTKVCAVARPADYTNIQDPARALSEMIRRDDSLGDRFADARMTAPPMMLGPLAVDARTPGVEGLLLAGDAAGFIDPITGDGLQFAMRGGELAAGAALHALATGDREAHVALARLRRAAFGRKWQLNRLIRRLVDCPAALTAAAMGACIAPAIIRNLIAIAGDCEHA